MSLTRQDITQATDEHVSEIRGGKRSLNSKFRLRCSHCHQLIDRGLKVGDKCPLMGGRCNGLLELNPEWKP